MGLNYLSPDQAVTIASPLGDISLFFHLTGRCHYMVNGRDIETLSHQQVLPVQNLFIPAANTPLPNCAFEKTRPGCDGYLSATTISIRKGQSALFQLLLLLYFSKSALLLVNLRQEKLFLSKVSSTLLRTYTGIIHFFIF